MSERFQVVDKRLDEMEQRLTLLELENKAAQQAPSQPAGFQPTYLEVKNICTYEERLTQGVSRSDAIQLYNTLKQQVPETLRPHVGEPALDGLRSARMKIPVSKGLNEVMGIWKDYLAQPTTYFNTRQLYVVRQRSPEEDAIVQQLGRVRSMLESVVTDDLSDKDLNIRTFFGRDRCCFVEETVAGKTTPTLVAQVSPQAEIVWHSAGLTLLGLESADAANQKVIEAVAARRR